MSGLCPEDRDWLRRSCKASGVPEKVNNPAVVLAAADILRTPPAVKRKAARS